jgi:hypothetical protein
MLYEGIIAMRLFSIILLLTISSAISLYGMQSSEIDAKIKHLQAIEDSQKFADTIVERATRGAKIESYEDNNLTRVIIPAIKDKSLEFKNETLADILRRMPLAHNAGVGKFWRAATVALIKGGADVNLKIPHEESPISYIAYDKDDLEYARALLDLGADINYQADRFADEKPLLFLAQTPELAEFLISRGASLNVTKKHLNGTLLHEAAGNDHKSPSLLRLYLHKYKLDVNMTNAFATTPLEYLIERGPLHYDDDTKCFEEKIKLFLDCNADYVGALASLEEKFQTQDFKETDEIAHRLLSQHARYVRRRTA